MTKAEKINLLNELLEYEEKNDIGNLTTAERGEFQQWVKALEQEPCKDWYDVPSDEMTLEQARRAVKDLRKKWAKYLEQKPILKEMPSYSDTAKHEYVHKDNFWVDLQVQIPISLAIEWNTITEQEIVKPYLDKIRAEIEQLRLHKAQFLTNDNKVCIDSQDVLNVVDKYKAESEE